MHTVQHTAIYINMLTLHVFDQMGFFPFRKTLLNRLSRIAALRYRMLLTVRMWLGCVDVPKCVCVSVVYISGSGTLIHSSQSENVITELGCRSVKMGGRRVAVRNY